jgi:Holliday junction resolvasome RuvABC endonuclease subunit
VSEKVFGDNLPNNVPVAVGIDQSLTGFAVSAVHVDDLSQHTTWVYKSPKSGVARLADIQWWLENKFDQWDKAGNRVQNIAMEGTVLASHSASILGELAGLVKLTCWYYFDGNMNSVIPYPNHLRVPLQVPPMTLKKFAAGKGNAKKQEMLLQIYKRYGVEFNNDNAADAYALARVASGRSIDAVEEAIIEQLKDEKFRDNIPE